MRTFYRSADIMVTSDHVVILQPSEMTYRLIDLSAPYIVRHGSASMEIRAHHGRSDVRLFETSDARTFGQVRRALVRALEQCSTAGR